jgi:hypothetical protein
MSGTKQQKNVFQKTAPLKSAADWGIDISMLIENMKRKPIERIRRHQIALNTVEKLRKARPA